MKKLSLTLIAAGLLAGAAGMAQAETLVLTGHNVIDTVAANGQHTYWIDTPVLVGSPIRGALPVATIDATPVATIASSSVLALAPVTITDTTVLGAGPVMVPMRPMVVPPGLGRDSRDRHDASATFDVPGRAGEASTMTNGVPNLETSNY